MGQGENRKVLYKNICASDEELEVLKKLYHSGISVKIQIVPEEKGFLWTRCCKSIVREWKNLHNVKGEEL